MADSPNTPTRARGVAGLSRPSLEDLVFLLALKEGIIDARTGEILSRWQRRLNPPVQQSMTATEARMLDGGILEHSEALVRQSAVPGNSELEPMGGGRVPQGVTTPHGMARFPNLEPLSDEQQSSTESDPGAGQDANPTDGDNDPEKTAQGQGGVSETGTSSDGNPDQNADPNTEPKGSQSTRGRGRG